MTTPAPPGGPYSAGTVFLQMVPSWDDFMRRVAREVKDIDKAIGTELGKGDEAGKGLAKNIRKAKKEIGDAGDEAAEQYAGRFRETMKRSLAKTAKEIKALRIDVETEDVQKKIRAVERHLERLKDVEIGVDLTADEAFQEMLLLEAKLKALSKLADDIEIRTNIKSASKDIAALRAMIEGLADKPIEIKAEIREKGLFARQLRESIRRALSNIPEIDITSDTSRIQAEMQTLRNRMMAILRDVEIGVDVDSGAVLLEIAALEARFELLEQDPIDVEVQVNAGAARAELAALRAQMNRMDNDKVNVRADADTGASFGQLANNLRAFNALVLIGATVGPLLVPVLAALAAAALGLGTALLGAGVGLGVLILGFSGITNAVKAINDVQKNAAKDALANTKAIRAASNGVRDAERGVTRAREDAAEATERASRQIQDALRAQERAERDLREAQEDARRAQQRLTEARAEAQDQLEDLALRARGGLLAERQAVIDLFEAEIAYRNAMADGGATNLEREQATINLERERLGLEQVRLENGRLAEEQAEVARTGVEGTEMVRQAQEGLAGAQERVVRAHEGVRDALRGVTDAQENAARVQRDGQQAVEDSLRRLEDARIAMDEARQASDLGSASVQKLNDEMSKLGPAGQAFAIFIAGLEDEFFALRSAVQEGLLPGVQQAIEALLPYLPALTGFLGQMGAVLGDIFVRAAEMFGSPIWVEFFDMLSKYAPIFTTLFAEGFGLVLTILAQLATAFAPFALEMTEGLVGLLGAFSTFLASAEGQQMLQDFMDYVREAGPQVLDLLGSLFMALVNLGIALAPYAGVLMAAFTSFLDWIAGMDPNTLAAIVLGIIGLTIVFQVLAGVLGFVGSVVGLVAGIIGLGLTAAGAAAIGTVLAIIGIVLAVIAVLVIAYIKFEWFRDFVNMVFTSSLEAAKMWFNGIQWYWQNILEPVFKAIVGWLRFVYDVWTSVFDLIIGIVKYGLGLISEVWSAFADTGAGKWITNFWRDTVAPAWSWFLDFVRSLWGDIQDVFKAGVRFVVETVINGAFIENFNKLAEFFQTKKITPITLPAGMHQTSESQALAASNSKRRFADGGEILGWSPSDRADNIMARVTAGEYVLPVQAVRMLRAKYGDQFLELLRQGLPGFAKGGLVEFGRLLQTRGFRVSEHPLFGGVSQVHTKNSKHYSNQAIDVNYAPGTSVLEQRAIDAIVHLAKDYGLETIWRAPGHFNHAHFQEGGRSILGKVFGAIKDAVGAMIGSPLNWLRDTVRGSYGALKETPFGRVLLAAPEQLIVAGARRLIGAGAEIGDFFTGGDDGDDKRLYDAGGWLPPGLTQVMNATGRPEAVFNAEQLEKLTIGAGGAREYHWHDASGSPDDFAEAIMFAERHMDRGGKYAGR